MTEALSVGAIELFTDQSWIADKSSKRRVRRHAEMDTAA